MMFDIENKHANVVVPSDVSDSLSEQETVDSNIEAATISQNDQQPVDRSTKETTKNSPPQNQKPEVWAHIYEHTPISNEHLQYALFSSHPTIFEEVVKDAQWVQANEEVNNEVAAIDDQHQDANALQEKLKYNHIFFDKNFQDAGKDDNQKNHVET